MEWYINGYCWACEHNGHRFELGEMGGGRWILKHWHKSPSSVWYDVTSSEEGKAKAEDLVGQDGQG